MEIPYHSMKVKPVRKLNGIPMMAKTAFFSPMKIHKIIKTKTIPKLKLD